MNRKFYLWWLSMLNSSDHLQIFSETNLTHQESSVSFWNRWYSLFVFGGASKWIPSLGFRFGAPHKKHTIYKQFNLLFYSSFIGILYKYSILEQIWKKIVKPNNFVPLKCLKSDLKRKIFSNSNLTGKQNRLFFWEFHWLELISKHFKNLLDLYFFLNSEKEMFI